MSEITNQEAQRVAMLIGRKAFRPKGDRLINTHVLTNNGGFANHDTCTMINKEALTNDRARVNINTSGRVCQFSNHASDKRQT